MNGESLLIYTVGGIFVLFCIVMAFGAHVLPTGPMMRNPSRRGDILIGLLAVCMLLAAVWIVYDGWRYIWGNHPGPKPEVAFFTPTISQGVTSAGWLSPESLQKPAPTKRQVRAYCKKFIEDNPNLNQCVVFMWIDQRFLPQTLPISPASLNVMTANYLYNKSGNLDRFCWLVNGKVLETNCF
ncbi:MAG: hypothetical protein EYC62_03460 [Alphaproteobacteria bacterium]|nr:MAG: hypothetical protein EYC62_03460 [Alphaproteobacteria bacterium]